MASNDSKRHSALSSSGTPTRKKRGLRREFLVAASSLAWAICFVVAMQVLEAGVVTNAPLAWLIAVVPSLAAVWFLVVYTRHLREIDELRRLIQLQAMAWAFGVGFFAICGYLLFVPLGAPDEHVVDLAAIMPFLFAIGTLVGSWRYR